MSDSKQPTFLVNPDTTPVAVQIHGKANYLNCNCFRDFLERMVDSGKNEFRLDFENCTGMDSTFLGILAGAALKVQKLQPAGKLALTSLSERNYDLLCNLGLEQLLEIEESSPNVDSASMSSLSNKEVSDASKVLNAHENLVEANQENAAKFQDVIAFLKNQIDTD